MVRELLRKSRRYSLYRYGEQTIKKRPLVSAAGFLTALLAIVTSVVLAVNGPQAQANTAPLVLGELPSQKMLPDTLSDRASIVVNAANGNLIFKVQDLKLRSAGPGLTIDRYFNSRASGAGQAGEKTTLGMGTDVTITANSNGSATYQGPSGFKVTFQPNGSGGYTMPAEFKDANLSTVTGGGWRLKYNKSGEVFAFNAAGKLTSHLNTAGLGVTYAYNGNGTLASATDSQGKVTTFTNYSGTKVGTVTDPAGRTIQYGYTSNKLTSFTGTDGKTWQLHYFGGGNTINQIDSPNGHTTSIVYDGSSRVTSIKYADYSTAVAEYKYTYNAGNTVVTDPLNHNTTYHYDASGRIVDIVDAVGAHQETTWDANNNQTALKDPAGQVRSLVYDTLNNLTSRQNPTTAGGSPGAAATSQYNDTAHPYRPSQTTDEAGNTVAYSYNVNGNVATATGTSSGGSAMGTKTYKYQGDPAGPSGPVNCGAKPGQLCSVTDAKNNVTTYAYNAQGNLTTITPPGPVGQTTYTYDNLSRPKTITDGNGSKVTVTYDGADRPTLLEYDQDNSYIWYAYNEDGYVTDMGDQTGGVTTYAYDSFNRVVYLKEPNRTALNYTYDAAGNLKTEQGPAGTVTYSYDNVNNVTDIVQSANGANIGFVYTHGRPTTIYKPGGIVETITYDNAGRQTSIKAVKNGVTLTHFSGTYAKPSGQDTALLQSETNHLTGRTSNYAYDGNNRLTGVNGVGTGANSYVYSYDKNGNRTAQTKNSEPTIAYGYNTANQLVTQDGYESGTFDGAGNQTSTGSGLWIDYNAQNQAMTFGPPSGGTLSAGYLGVGQTERTNLGSKTMQNGLMGIYSETTSGTTRYYTHAPQKNGQILGQAISGTAYFYLTDLRGSTVKMTDINGVVKNTYDYDPYGVQLNATGTTPNAIRYASGYLDEQTALYKFGARYYNPSDGRWTQTDPSGQDEGYLYANVNPVNFVDPDGYLSLSFECARTLAFGAFGGGFALGSGVGGLLTATTGVGVAAGFAGALAGIEALDAAFYALQVDKVCG
ncbi:MAG TPA: RHS repeat-associated core domain-containing protein [Candidatus Saccharimonadales bacterium]|nr:RHS repeat-associated core domain-containing protein [Candidatus Saccharimonadales bacterium]